MTRICQNCGNEFESQHNAKWCADCREIMHRARAKKSRENRKAVGIEIGVPAEKRCGHCGEVKAANDFSPQRDRPNGLSGWCKACKAEKKKADWRSKPRIPKQPKPPEPNGLQCKVCGADLVGQQKNVCSNDECRKEQARRYDRELNAVRKPLIKQRCKECRGIFVPEYGNKRRVFCSDECLERWNNRQRQRGGDLNSRARKYFRRLYGMVPLMMYQYINWHKVMKRSAWRCGLCGQPIDPNKKCPEDESPSVDHIVPLSKGGAHLYNNVQAAHFRCNWEKGGDA